MMARPSFLLGLTTVLLSLVSTTFGEDQPPKKINDILTVQRGENNGGCDNRITTLDQWVFESTKSIGGVLDVIGDWKTDDKVRDSLSVFFGITAEDDDAVETEVLEIERRILVIWEFLNKGTKPNGNFYYNQNLFWLLCDSNFLTEQQRTSTARDKTGMELFNAKKEPITIEKIPAYKRIFEAKETKDFEPWWAGDHTGLNGYYFDDVGGNYCKPEDNLGLTAGINLLAANRHNDGKTAAVIICPGAFDNKKPDDYKTSNQKLAAGKNLLEVLPKSTTLLHELFHAVHGTDMRSGDDEAYDVAGIVDLANGGYGEGIRNPESFVFFIAHMWHLYGEASEGIVKNWDFEVIDLGVDKKTGKMRKKFGAREPKEPEPEPVPVPVPETGDDDMDLD